MAKAVPGPGAGDDEPLREQRTVSSRREISGGRSASMRARSSAALLPRVPMRSRRKDWGGRHSEGEGKHQEKGGLGRSQSKRDVALVESPNSNHSKDGLAKAPQSEGSVASSYLRKEASGKNGWLGTPQHLLKGGPLILWGGKSLRGSHRECG